MEVLREEMIEETFTAQKDLEELTNNIIIKLSEEAVREWKHNHFLNPDDSDLRFLPTIYTGTMKGEGYGEIGEFVDETSIRVQLTSRDIEGSPSIRGNFGYGISPRGVETFEIKVKHSAEDLEEINKIFREKGEEATDKDVYIKLWFMVHTTLLHELQHAYDGWRSKGKSFQGQETEKYKEIKRRARELKIKDFKDLTPEEMDAIDAGTNAYLNLTHEINARFAQALHKISLKTINVDTWDDKALPWKHVFTSFKSQFRGWHVLSDKMKRKLTRRLAKAYQETNDNLKTSVEKYGEKEAAELLALKENVQLADKIYFKPGKLSQKVRQVIIDRITGGDAWTKLIADIYFAEFQHSLRQGEWTMAVINGEEIPEEKEEYTSDDDILHVDTWKRIKSYYQQLKEYNKNVFPIKGLNPNGVEDIWSLIGALNQRPKILEMMKKLPSVAIRNMKADIRTERDGNEMNQYRHNLDYFLSHYSLLDNRDAELKKFVENKMFKSGVTLKELLNFVEEKENLLGGKKFDKEVIKNMIADNNHHELEVIYEKDNIMVVEVSGPYGIKDIGCNSLWCFTYGEGYSRNWSQYSYNDTVYVIIDFDEPSDSPEFMNVVIRPLVWNPKSESEEEVNDETVFDMANHNRYDALPYLNGVLGLETAKELLTFYVEPDEEEDYDDEEEEYDEQEPKVEKDPAQLSLFETRNIIKKVLKEQVSDMYLDQAISLLCESDEPSPTFEWDIAKEKIDRSLRGVDTKSEAIQYLKKFFDKIKNLPKAVKNGVAKYVVMTLVGLLGYNLILSMVPEGMPEVTKEIIIQMSTEEMNKPEEPHVNPTSSSEQLVDFLKYEEGSIKHKGEPVLKAYKLGDGMITVGWGHAERVGHSNLRKGDTISRAEAETLLAGDIKEAEGGLNRLLKRWEDAGIELEIDQGMYDAMTSMIFNMGIGNFLKSDFIQLVKQGKFEEARDKILTTNVSYPGHVPRREQEAAMFGKNLPYMANNQALALKEIRQVLREVFMEGVNRKQLTLDYFIKRIPFIKGYEVVYDPEHYPHSSMPLRIDMTNRKMSENVTLPMGDEVYTFPKVYAISEFFYYPHTVNDNTFHIVGVTNKIHLEKPDNMSPLQYQVLIRAMQMKGEQEMSSVNEIMVPVGEDIPDSEMDAAISDINKKMFEFEDSLSDWQVEKMF